MLGGSGSEAALADAMDDLDELVESVAVLAGETNEGARLVDHLTLLRSSSDSDATTATELQQSFVAKLAERSQDGVGVHAEDGGEVSGRREALSLLGFSVGDRAAHLAGDLCVEIDRVVAVHLDIQHGAIDNSLIVTTVGS
jgi:hypothetical protein